MCIAIIYSWDRFDNELQMLVIIWCDGPVTTKGFKDTDAWIPLKTRRAHISHKTKNYFSCYFKKKREKKEKPDCPCESFGSPAAMSGEGDRWLQHREKCYFSQVHDAKQHLHYSGELLWYRVWTVSSHNNPRTSPTTGQGFSLWFAELQRGEEKKKKEEGGSARGPSQMELGLRPTFCHCTSTTVAPGYK